METKRTKTFKCNRVENVLQFEIKLNIQQTFVVIVVVLLFYCLHTHHLLDVSFLHFNFIVIKYMQQMLWDQAAIGLTTSYWVVSLNNPGPS